MLWLLPFTMMLAAGWFLARALTSGTWSGPRWSTALVEVSLGALLGPGIASLLYFAMITARVASPGSVTGMLVALLAASASMWWKFAPAHSGEVEKCGRFPWTWALWIGVSVGLILFLMDFQAASNANPFGEWDAVAIWNARARYLVAGGDLWRRAMSSEFGGHMVGAAHPAYPLFLSGFIGLMWSAGGGFGTAAPILASLLFALTAVALLGGSLAAKRSVSLGLLAWLVLFASEVFASQAAAQYSDLLQGFAFLSVVVLLDAAAEDSRAGVLVAAGLAIGMSAWIKDEGIVFALAALATAAWRFRGRGLVLVGAGALPGLLATAVLKLVLAQGREEMFPRSASELVGRIAGAGRWWQAALGFGKAVFEAGNWWSHPVLLAALLALAVRFIPKADARKRAWLFVPVGVVAAAEYGLYLITAADLDWHISTSVSRLLAQLWPSLIWLTFMMLRTPEEAFPLQVETARVPAAAAAGGGSQGKRKRR